jgi:hypothetical protein
MYGLVVVLDARFVGIMCPATIFKITWNYFIFGIPHSENMHLLGMELNILAGIYLVHGHA